MKIFCWFIAEKHIIAETHVAGNVSTLPETSRNSIDRYWVGSRTTVMEGERHAHFVELMGFKITFNRFSGLRNLDASGKTRLSAA